MDSKIDPAELETTKGLLKDFAADTGLSAEEVYRKSWLRFNNLEQAPIHSIFHESRISRILQHPIYAKLPIVFHRFIYDGLFTFAGNYRSKDWLFRSSLCHPFRACCATCFGGHCASLGR